MAKYSEAQKRATNKWMKNNYDNVSLTLPKGQKDIWKKAAEEHGLSLNEFIRQCVREKL